jgi:hypothetical protein
VKEAMIAAVAKEAVVVVASEEMTEEAATLTMIEEATIATVVKEAPDCHTPFRERGNEASIRVPRMFKSHAWQQYD